MLRDPEDAHDVFQNELGQPENPSLADIQDQLNDLSAEMHERFLEFRPLRRTGMAALWGGLFSIWGALVIGQLMMWLYLILV